MTDISLCLSSAPERGELEKGHLTCLWCCANAILSFELQPGSTIIYNTKW